MSHKIHKNANASQQAYRDHKKAALSVQAAIAL